MLYDLMPQSVGSVYCPECGMHVGKCPIQWWFSLSKAEQQSECPQCPNRSPKETFDWAHDGF